MLILEDDNIHYTDLLTHGQGFDEDPVDDNVYVEVAEPEPEVVLAEMEVQTEQEKGHNSEQQKALDLKRKQMRDSIIEDLLHRKKEQQ